MELLIILAIVYFVASNAISRSKQEAQRRRDQKQGESALADSMEIIRKGSDTRSDKQETYTPRERSYSNQPSRRNINKQRSRLDIREREKQLRQNRSERLKSNLENRIENQRLDSRGGYTHTYNSVFDDEDDWGTMLSELEEFYHDSDLEEDSWMNDSQLNVLQEVENIQDSARRRQSSQNIAQLFNNPQSVRQAIIFSEIINQPKAKQKQR